MPQGAHSDGRERAGRSRAAAALFRELIGRFAPAFVVLGAASFAGACDQGSQHYLVPPVGPALHVVGFNGTAAKGLLPADGTVQIAFDRLLDPASVTRQSFGIRDDAGHFLQPVVTYDPVTRIVSLATPSPGTTAWLTAGATYEVSIPVAQPKDFLGASGPRAIDGATLTAGVVETFRAVAPATTTPSEDRAIDFCNDVIPVFQNNCSGGPCHGTPTGNGTFPMEGLALDSPIGVLNTAIGRASQESNTGARAGAGTVSTRLFGVDMPIIDPGNPGNSWLMYKVLLSPGGPAVNPMPVACFTGAPAPPPVSQATPANPAAPSVPLSNDERAILGEHMIGNQMPYPPVAPLATDEIERVSAWIAQGAKVVQCPKCPGP